MNTSSFKRSQQLSVLAAAKTLLLSAAIMLASISGVSAQGFDHQHALFNTVLQQHVSKGDVNYAAIKANPEQLEKYIAQAAAVSRAEFDGWNQAEKISFLSNLYNAVTLKLIIDNYPVKSIKKIGGFFTSPWSLKVVPLFGEQESLDYLEHKVIRKWFNEPRIHFALVCAAKSCPPLRSEAYVPSRMDEQFDDQGRVFMAQTSKNRVSGDGSTLVLSKIFDWYGGDFTTGDRSVADYVKPYLPEAARARLASNPRLKYSDYDWSLNKQ